MSRRIREIAWRRSPSRMWVFQVYIALSIVYRTYFLAIFGYQRKCPREPLAETFWDIKKCDKDKDWYVEESKKFLLALHINMEYMLNFDLRIPVIFHEFAVQAAVNATAWQLNFLKIWANNSPIRLKHWAHSYSAHRLHQWHSIDILKVVTAACNAFHTFGRYR